MPVLSLMTTLPGIVSPNGLNSSLNPFWKPFRLTKSSVSLEANTAMEGENERMIKDLVLSELSETLPRGELRDDLWGRDVEPESRLLGDAERD